MYVHMFVCVALESFHFISIGSLKFVKSQFGKNSVLIEELFLIRGM